MKLFTATLLQKKIGFQPVDPLDDGLGDDIEEERHESQAIHFEMDDTDDIQRFWSAVEHDIHAGGAVDFAEE